MNPDAVPGAFGGSPFDLVIFDCDGVLVDSERIQVPIEVAALNALGWAIDEAELVERFLGRSAAECDREIEEHLGGPIPAATVADIDRLCREAFEASLRPVPGVTDLLETLGTKGIGTCVASSSRHERIEQTLRITGLEQHFEGRVFSAEDVERGKPEPDLFLHAARQCGARPERCAVVEDSPYGVRAALAAGMTPFAFTGSLTPRHRLEVPGAVLFDDMSALGALLCHSAAAPAIRRAAR